MTMLRETQYQQLILLSEDEVDASESDLVGSRGMLVFVGVDKSAVVVGHRWTKILVAVHFGSRIPQLGVVAVVPTDSTGEVLQQAWTGPWSFVAGTSSNLLGRQ